MGNACAALDKSRGARKNAAQLREVFHRDQNVVRLFCRENWGGCPAGLMESGIVRSHHR